MKKLIAVVLCFAMLACMPIMASAATINLPDGGQTGNTGYARAIGYSDGGSSGRALMNCSVAMTSTAYGDVTASITCSKVVGDALYLGIVAWQDAAQKYNLASSYGRKYGVGLSGSWTLRGGSATHHGTAGFTYNSAEYGDWVCGVTTTG